MFFASFSAQNEVIMSRKHAQSEPKNRREERRIIEVLQNVESLSRAEPAAAIDFQDSKATLKRELKRGKTVLRIGQCDTITPRGYP